MADDEDQEGCFYPMLSFRNGYNGAFNTSGLGYYWSSGQGGSVPSAYYLKLGAYFFYEYLFCKILRLQPICINRILE